MKINIICFRFSKAIYFIICIILIGLLFFIIHMNFSSIKEKTIQTSSILNSIEEEPIENIISYENIQSTLPQKIETVTKEQTRVLPTDIKGFEIIGKIEIPKLNISNYILKDSNSNSLKVSVTKLYGPEINCVGNFCIAGHNYKKMFKDIINLEENDQIVLSDIYGNGVTYQVYDNYQTSPKDLSCLDQNTNEERELTLITCTTGAINRVIIKAIEVYD